MANVSKFGARTDNAMVEGTLTDNSMIIPDVPPNGLMSIGPRITPNFVIPREWSEQTTYHFFDAVRDASGNAYVAIKPVIPAGTSLDDEKYWFLWADPDTRFDELNEIVKTFNERITNNENEIKLRIKSFATVDDMKSASNLEAGEVVRTEGFYEPGIGGSLYIIKNSGTPNNMDIFSCNNGLFAEKIKNYPIIPEEYGAHGNGIADDSAVINYCTGLGSILLVGNYAIANKINIVDSVETSGNGMLSVIANIPVAIEISPYIQIINKNFRFTVNANAKAEVAVQIGIVKSSKFKIRVVNAGTTGIIANVAKKGNNENIFNFNVAGNSNGTTETGVNLNCYDSYTEMICTQDCKTGVVINASDFHIGSLHSWISESMKNILWDSSIVINAGTYIGTIDWLYQDSVKIGFSGAGIVRIKYFNYNNTHESPNTDYINFKSTTVLRTIVDLFINLTDEHKYAVMEYQSNNEKFGIKTNGHTINENLITNAPFEDMNDAPTIGTFYLPYNITNLPATTNSIGKFDFIGNAIVQTVITISPHTIWNRIKTINGEWTEWQKITQA